MLKHLSHEKSLFYEQILSNIKNNHLKRMLYIIS